MTPAASRVAVALALGLAGGTLAAAAAGLAGLRAQTPLPLAAVLALRVGFSLAVAVPTYRSAAWRRLSLWRAGPGPRAYVVSGFLAGAVVLADLGLHAVVGAKAGASVGPLALSALCLIGAVMALRD